jgi:hypothetical protein
MNTHTLATLAILVAFATPARAQAPLPSAGLPGSNWGWPTGLRELEQRHHDDRIIQRPEALLSEGGGLSRPEGEFCTSSRTVGLHGVLA